MKWLRVIFFNVIILLSGLFMLELIMGSWFSKSTFGRLIVPNEIKRKFNVSNLYDQEISLYIRDQYGLRGNYGKPSDIDILTVGGSTTNEIFVNEGETWSDRLAAAFQDSGYNIQVANAGIDGQSTIGHLKNFELWFSLIPKLKPKYIILYVGINDSALAEKTEINQQDIMKNNRRPIRQYIRNNSAIYSMYANIRGMIHARDAQLLHGGKKPRTYEYVYPKILFDVDTRAQEISGALQAYANRLEKIIYYIRELGAQAIIVTQNAAVYRYDSNGKLLVRKIDGQVNQKDLLDHATLLSHNQTAMVVCQKLNAICIDLAEKLRLDVEDYYDSIHTTPSGSAKIGRFLFQILKPYIK